MKNECEKKKAKSTLTWHKIECDGSIKKNNLKVSVYNHFRLRRSERTFYFGPQSKAGALVTVADNPIDISDEIQPTGCCVVHWVRALTTYFPLYGPPPTCIGRLMCLANVNDNHFMALDLKDDCPIPPTCNLWRQHHREDADSWPDRYVSRMVDYNELSRAAGQEMVEDDEELYIIENLVPDERVGHGLGVKVEVDDSPIDLSAP